MNGIDKNYNNGYNNIKCNLINNIRSHLLKLAKYYNGNIKIEFDVNPKMESVKTKITQYL